MKHIDKSQDRLEEPEIHEGEEVHDLYDLLHFHKKLKVCINTFKNFSNITTTKNNRKYHLTRRTFQSL